MKCILVGVSTKYDRYDIDYSLNELKALAEVLNYEVTDKVYQILDKPNTRTYIGSGKLSEIKIMIYANDIDIVIFNDELTPSQLRNISDELQVEVIDRSFLILEIFELRASNLSAKLEIKLAKDLYLLPRIQYMHQNQSRIGGGASTKTRGSGETQRELDRRHLMSEINHLKSEIITQRQMKINQIERRKKNDIPIVALVGYTNSGKSTTMNKILEKCGVSEEKSVLAKDQLFATLETYNRKLEYNKSTFMLVDTIGFVSKLPHNLVNSFYQTLQEIKNADLIIHVLDSSSKYINEQLSVVTEVLYSLDASDINTVFLLNKWDKTIDADMNVIGKKSIRYSNKADIGVDELLDTIYLEVSKTRTHVRLILPYGKGELINTIEENSEIIKREYQEDGIYYEIEIPSKMYHLIKEYDLDMMVS
ncbi:MAG: GTPase HflX [Acholeplasmatales bacterium]|nr:GTPase HflX [Acholeplasmatales bacterium]